MKNLKPNTIRPSSLAAATMLASVSIARAQVVVEQVEPNDSLSTATATGLTAESPGGILTMGNNGDGPFGPSGGDGSGDFDFFALEAGEGQTIVLDIDDGSLRFRIEGSEVILTEPDAIEDEKIYHIVVTHLDSDGFDTGEAERTRLYINGEMVGEETDTFEFPLYPDGAANTRLWIATHSAAGSGYNGDMDDFQIYNVELTPEEVRGIFENPGTTASAAPLAPIQFTEILFDQTTRNVSLTWDSKPNKSYTLENSSSLEAPWIEVSDGISSDGASTSAMDEAVSVDVPERYYRVTEE